MKEPLPMAHYRTTIQSKKSQEVTFEYLTDFANAREWDPGVVEGENLTGQPIGPGSRFRLVSRFLGRRIPLEYRIVAFEPPGRVVFQADQAAVWSTDEIRFVPDGGGTSVTYDADLRLKGALGRLIDPLLGLAFRRIGNRAAAGLGKALNL
jgi:carbon monoxide dehydrogenase subunit G